MKKLVCLVCVLLCLRSYGQKVQRLEVSVNKTVSLLFPAAIVSVDRGSEHIVVQKATVNVLKVKADSAFTDTTNLTVITSEGKLYSFLTYYNLSPPLLVIDLGIGNNVLKDTALAAMASHIKEKESKLHGVKFSSGKVLLACEGVYTNGELLAFKLRIDNRSSINYEIGAMQVVVSGGRSGKRRAVQEHDIPILLTDIERYTVREKQSSLLVIIIPKAGLGADQTLQIHLQEKGSDRGLHLGIPNLHLLNATLLK